MTPPAPDDIRRQLDRIANSTRFSGAGRMRRFLRFVVEEALAGRDDRLKEYVIGVEVFDRADDFDPRVDSLVRVEAGRLRARLDAYYRAEGAADGTLGDLAELAQRIADAVPPPSHDDRRP
jgi:adenylate cyclase